MNIVMADGKILFLILTLSGVIGAVSGYIGSLMVTKRMSLMGGALGHLALPGIALALRYGFDVSIGASLFLTGGIILIWLLEKKTSLPVEALTAIVFASSVATAFLFLPKQDTETALIGNITNISLSIVFITTIICILIFILLYHLYKKLVFISISQDLAKVEHVRINLVQFWYLVCIALVITVGIRIVGGLLTAALVAIPAATAKNVSQTLTQYAYLSLILGFAACEIGTLIFYLTGISAGPLMIITSTFFFLISLFFVKKQ